MSSALEELARYKEGVSRRISSYDRTGANRDRVSIAPGETVDIANIPGSGVIKHIWLTWASTDPMFYRNAILRMYWDGETAPSVESPLGDVFGQGWGECYPYVALPLCATPERSVNCYLPMPFADGARIEIENDSEHPCRALFYYVDYEERRKPDENLGRFHAQWCRHVNSPPLRAEHPRGNAAANLTDRFNHVFIDARGSGHYVGLNYYVDTPDPGWYGEGDDMFFIDGESWPPSLHGTGTEDYFNCSFCPRKVYLHPYFGYARVNDGMGFLGRTHCYRFHVEDPIIFRKSLRGSIEQGHANNVTMDLATVAYWYQSEPHKPFSPLPPRAGRQNMPSIGTDEIRRWREAWLQMMGGGGLWGHEPLPPSLDRRIERADAPVRKKMAPPENARSAARLLKEQEKMLNRRKRRS
jgi:hypothetical protein